MGRFYVWWGSLGSAGRWRIAVLVVLLIGAVIPTAVGFALNPDWSSLLLNLGSEMGGGLITFILIDMIVAQRDAQEAREHQLHDLRQRLIHKLGSSINTESRRAAEELRMLGWLSDGSLDGVELVGANLEGVNLRGAVLRNAKLFRSNLKGAHLYGADLSGAFLTGSNLSGAHMGRVKLDGAWLAGTNLSECKRIPRGALARARRLKGAIMPDGSRYDGCYGLQSDLRQAQKDCHKLGKNAQDAAALAEWYGVPVEDYLQGQQRGARIIHEVGAALMDHPGDDDEHTGAEDRTRGKFRAGA